MSYIIGIVIAIIILIVVLIAFVFLGKILVIFFAKKFAIALATKAIDNATQYAKDQIKKTMAENNKEGSEEAGISQTEES